MPWPRKSKTKPTGRVVRHKLADGSVKEYRYEKYKPERPRREAGTMSALTEAYRLSPEWRALAARTRAA